MQSYCRRFTKSEHPREIDSLKIKNGGNLFVSKTIEHSLITPS